MASRHTKISFPSKILNLFHSKNSLFYLFIFMIGLPIGFVCSFYLQSFSAAVHTSIFNIFRSLSLLSPPPPPPPPHANTLSSLTPPPSLVSPPPLTSNLPQLSLPLPDNLSLSPPPLTSNLPQPPLPLPDNLSLSPPPLTSNLSQPPLPLQLPHNLSLSPPLPPLTSNLSQPPLPLQLPHNLSLSPPLTSNLPEPPLPLPDDLSLSPPPLSSESIPSATSPSSLPFKVSITEQVPMMHNLSDDDLVKRVMEIPKMTITNAPYKVAFMFLTPGPLPLSPLWELFFKGHEGLFSIYVHPHPSYNDTIPQDSVFYGTRITSQPLYWGDISMVDAERRLLANALLDPSNQRFVLLSDSCIPLFNFTTTYGYLVNSNLSYIASFDDKRKSGRGRYNSQMSPNITIQDWRKGSQWFEVNRDLALEIVAEQNYYSLFKEYCYPPCYNDEHYLPTLVNILYGGLNSNRTITHVDWSRAGPHPRKYAGSEITEELLNSIRFGSTECVYNDNTTPMCVLFARKFTPGTLNPLLMFAPLLFGSN